MHIAESRIIGLNVAHDGSGLVDVTLERVLVSPEAASKLAIGDKVSLGAEACVVPHPGLTEAWAHSSVAKEIARAVEQSSDIKCGDILTLVMSKSKNGKNA